MLDPMLRHHLRGTMLHWSLEYCFIFRTNLDVDVEIEEIEVTAKHWLPRYIGIVRKAWSVTLQSHFTISLLSGELITVIVTALHYFTPRGPKTSSVIHVFNLVASQHAQMFICLYRSYYNNTSSASHLYQSTSLDPAHLASYFVIIIIIIIIMGATISLLARLYTPLRSSSPLQSTTDGESSSPCDPNASLSRELRGKKIHVDMTKSFVGWPSGTRHPQYRRLQLECDRVLEMYVFQLRRLKCSKWSFIRP